MEVSGTQKLSCSLSAQAAFPHKPYMPYTSADQLSRQMWMTVMPGDRAQAQQKKGDSP